LKSPSEDEFFCNFHLKHEFGEISCDICVKIFGSFALTAINSIIKNTSLPLEIDGGERIFPRASKCDVESIRLVGKLNITTLLSEEGGKRRATEKRKPPPRRTIYIALR
jgi:hypothetical protein